VILLIVRPDASTRRTSPTQIRRIAWSMFIPYSRTVWSTPPLARCDHQD
jgi:hypothetical protein